MEAVVLPELRATLIERLRRAGARFAFLHGSRAAGNARPTSDVDVAAWWGSDPPPPWEADLPENVDLLVLDTAPLELAGRVALHGALLFDDDPPARVRWQAHTRLVYLDEEERQRRLGPEGDPNRPRPARGAEVRVRDRDRRLSRRRSASESSDSSPT